LPFETVVTGGKGCARPGCGDREKIMLDGSCQVCDLWTVVDEDGTGCVMPECMFNEVVNMDGTCEACDPYTRVSDTRI